MALLLLFSSAAAAYNAPAAHGMAPSSTAARSAASVVMSSKVQRNSNIGKLQAGYLFPEIGRRRNAYLEANPDSQPIISLGIGDTTMPVPDHILGGLKHGAARLGTKEGYTGYGPEQGIAVLREKIAKNLYDDKIDPSEVRSGASRARPSAPAARPLRHTIALARTAPAPTSRHPTPRPPPRCSSPTVPSATSAASR